MEPPYSLHRAILDALVRDHPKNTPHLNEEGNIEITWRGHNYVIRAIPKKQLTLRAFLYKP